MSPKVISSVGRGLAALAFANSFSISGSVLLSLNPNPSKMVSDLPVRNFSCAVFCAAIAVCNLVA
ncbi:hypothetical protein D3C87_2168890 [compost metagenome]